ncbi:CDR ABC transporter [Penicillium desertorum]|uniref:CDR ABC transporter n=1 Tax=Penicillium desertorum TaxID=1303715 RepID=A0A9W9WE70_9EURO|nr:CDR ABC transporter [Penicillium desertorum]
MEKDYDEPEFAPITGRVGTVLEEREQETLTRIASSKLGQQLSRSASKKEGVAPHLDPTNPQFDHGRWAQMVLDQASHAGIDIPHQGVVFSNLCVSGSGSALQYQETLTSSLNVPFRAATRALTGRTSPSRQILRGFDGLLQGGRTTPCPGSTW